MPPVIHPARWSLRRRLVLGIVVLLAVVSVVVGGASALVLRQNLLNRLDGQVGQSLNFATGNNGGGPGAGTPPDSYGPRRIGGLLLYSLNGTTVAGAVGEDGTALSLTTAQVKQLLAVSGPPRVAQTLDLGGSLGDVPGGDGEP